MFNNNDSKDITFYAFQSNVRHFLANLLREPINTQPSELLKGVGLTKQKLINILLKRDVIRRHEKIDDTGETKNYVVTYKVVRKQFERKLKRIYNKYVENNDISDKSEEIDEATTCTVSGQYTAPLFSKPLKRESINKKKVFVTETQYKELIEKIKNK